MKHHRITTNGTTLHAVEDGPADGAPILLLHGFPETWWSWRHQIPELVKAGYRVIAMDLRGYGESDKNGPYDFDTATADVLGLLDHFGLSKVRLVGHDWGGVLGWYMTSHQSARFERFVAINAPHGRVFRKALKKFSQIKRSWYIFAFQIPWVGERMIIRNNGAVVPRAIRGSTADRNAISKKDVEPFREALLQPGAATAMLGWYRAAAKFKKSADAITIPVKLIWGMNDTALGYDDCVPGTEKYVSELTITKLEGLGHFCHEEAPARVTPEILSFFRS
ncbi:MAG: alpha/beta hydrolase [Clostridia bacterium]|nr:alpha/beta hydrolase [Deltaproteobacteria bacterium]